VGWGLPLTPI